MKRRTFLKSVGALMVIPVMPTLPAVIEPKLPVMNGLVCHGFSLGDKAWITASYTKGGALYKVEWNGKLWELLYFDRQLTEAEIDSIDSYLRHKYRL